jgi:hypothetical protein
MLPAGGHGGVVAQRRWRDRSGSGSATAFVSTAALGLLLAAAVPASGGPPGDDPFADEVIDYQPGEGAAPGYADPATALGEPERLTGEGVFPGVVSILNGPWLDTEIVSLGEGGCLTLRFDTPVTDDPANPFGVDLLIFGNAFFVGDDAGITGLFADGGSVEVSPDGATWSLVPDGSADGLYPTQGWRDAGPFDAEPGDEPTDFTRPVNPAFTVDHFIGRGYAEALAMYGPSGGGAPVDVGVTGLESVSFVRICNPVPGITVEIDAVADVAPVVPGDTNDDGVVNVDDLLNVIVQWGPIGPGTSADLDGDGMVNVDDLVTVIVNWG